MAPVRKTNSLRISPMAANTTWAQLFAEVERRAKANQIKSRDGIIDIINRLMPHQEAKSMMLAPRASFSDARRKVETSVRWTPGTMNMTLDFTFDTRADWLLNTVPFRAMELRHQMASIAREWERHMMPVTLEHLFLGLWDGEWKFSPISEACRRRYWNKTIQETARELEREIIYPELYESLVKPSQFILETFSEMSREDALAVQRAISTMAKATWANARAVCVETERLQRMVDSTTYMPPHDDTLESLYPKEEDVPLIEKSLQRHLSPLTKHWQDINDFFDVSDQNAESELLRTVSHLLVRKNEFQSARANRIQDLYLAVVFHTKCPLADDLEYVIFDTRQMLRAAFGKLPAWFRPEASLCPPGCRSNAELHQRLEAARQFYFDHKETLAVKPDLAVVVSRPNKERRTGGTWLHWDIGDECTVPLTGPVRTPDETWQPCPDEELMLP